jgi:SNF2 family DNA or RNA helicase
MIYNPYPYQEHATEHIIENDGCGLFLEMGLGKTVSTLTAIDRLMYDEMKIQKVLVIAPKKVAEETWSTESQKWDHLKHLRLSLVLGSEGQRKQALLAKADIYVINRENVAWLIAHYGTAFPFDMTVIDELSSFKSAKSIRFKSLRQVRPKIKKVVGLTGTPMSNGLLDLWSQLYLLDMGQRLGATLTGYREKYFRAKNRNGFIVYKYAIRSGDEDGDDLLGADIYSREIFDKISDICISMKAADYLTLPERITRDVPVHLPDKVKASYDAFEKSQILALIDQEEISAVNAAALTNKLLQFANGAVYGEDGDFFDVHPEKLEALEEIIESAGSQSVLIFYSYRHDLVRIKKHLKHYQLRELRNSTDIREWNNGEVPVLLAHPASAGHGLNLQAGGNIIIWFGLPWSLELYMQANARLDRQGQTKPVIVHRLITKNTMDEDVVLALDRKAGGQNALMDAVKARIKKYKVLM